MATGGFGCCLGGFHGLSCDLWLASFCQEQQFMQP